MRSTWISLSLFYIPYLCTSTNYILKESKVPCHPCHVHISYGDTPSDITVVWATMQNCNSTLSYGTDPWNYQNTATVEMTHFDKTTISGLTCVYRAQLKNLQPNTTYFYKPTSGDISSGPHFFKTPSPYKTTEFLICGDHGMESDSLPFLYTEVSSGNYDAVLHVGDFTHDLKINNSQDTNTTEEEVCYPQSGDIFMTMVSNIASRVPYLTTSGDHIAGDLFSHYRHWFSTPGTPWPIPLNQMWYSIDIGPVHFVSYSTEVFFLENQMYANDQKSWLMEDLMKVNMNRTSHPWIIAFGYKPMYCSYNNEEDCAKVDSKVRQGLEDLFFTYGVDLVVQSHGSSYERLFPQYKGRVLNTDYINPKGPVQITTGTTNQAGDSVQKTNLPQWSALRLRDKGVNSFTRLKAYNSTHLSWEQIAAKTKEVLDSVWIVQEKHDPFIIPQVPVTESPHKPSVSQDETKVDTPSKATDTSASSVGDSNLNKEPTTSSSVSEFFSHTSNKVLLGVGVGVITLILVVSVIIIVKRKQRIRSYRRWDATVDYGRKFYSAYSQVGKDDKDGSDFEVDSSEGNPSSKLLADRTP